MNAPIILPAQSAASLLEDLATARATLGEVCIRYTSGRATREQYVRACEAYKAALAAAHTGSPRQHALADDARQPMTPPCVDRSEGCEMADGGLGLTRLGELRALLARIEREARDIERLRLETWALLEEEEARADGVCPPDDLAAALSGDPDEMPLDAYAEAATCGVLDVADDDEAEDMTIDWRRDSLAHWRTE